MITMKGVTFIELLIVIAVITVLLGLTVPMGIGFYRKQQLDTVTNGMVQALRRAQSKAMSQADYSFGVYVGSGHTGEYILFRGDSYGTSDDQESFDIPSSFSFSESSEIVFSELKGIPSATGSIVLTSGNNIGTIYINELGKISYEYSTFLPPPPPPPPPTPTIYFSSTNYSVLEDSGNTTIQVNLSASSSNIVTIDYQTADGTAQAPQDYTSTSGTLTFNPGITSQTFQVSIVADTSVENDETVNLSLSNPHNADLGTPNQATLTILNDDAAPTYCWGIGGSCNAGCTRSSHGSLTNYYTSPGCSELCSSAGSFYANPSGSCSTNGTGSCYRMNSSVQRYTSCSKGSSCEGDCSGTCTSCRGLMQIQCEQQDGCDWFEFRPGRGICWGICTVCSDFTEETTCQAQSGCSWDSTKWYWNLGGSTNGYSSYTACQWIRQ